MYRSNVLNVKKKNFFSFLLRGGGVNSEIFDDENLFSFCLKVGDVIIPMELVEEGECVEMHV